MAAVSETPNLQNLQSIPYDKLTFKHERTEDFFKKKHNTFSHPPSPYPTPTRMAVHYRLLLFYLMLSLCQ